MTTIQPNTDTRILTITDLSTPTGSVPFIRISGKWLQTCGFEKGQTITLQVEKGRIEIRPNPPAPDPRSAAEKTRAERAQIKKEQALQKALTAASGKPTWTQMEIPFRSRRKSRPARPERRLETSLFN